MIYFITGGERSGKSVYAQKLALKLSERPYYIATSRVNDEDFKQRVKRHKKERSDSWTNFEEEKQLSKINLMHKVAVIDCVTLWITNFWIDTKYNLEISQKQIEHEIERLASVDCTLIIISNEIGMGLHASTQNGRKFVELQGWINQYIAKKADKVIFMVSGLPIIIKQ